MANLVTVANRGLGNAQALPQVRLRERASDSVGIRVSAERDEHVLAACLRERFSESVCP
jgi:hypothetical protein